MWLDIFFIIWLSVCIVRYYFFLVNTAAIEEKKRSGSRGEDRESLMAYSSNVQRQLSNDKCSSHYCLQFNPSLPPLAVTREFAVFLDVK